MLSFSVTPFHELSPAALYELLALRQLVFSVEQNCAYLDCDGKDQKALHLLGSSDDGRLVAYARLLPPGVCYPEASIGRVVNHPAVRRSGCGQILMQEAISQLVRAFGPVPIRIGAQAYLRRFYESFGFVTVSDPYDEDGILHILMLREKDQAPLQTEPHDLARR
ncbi:MAG: GNAT family N-acetyltransferase [Polyangia bacterium]